MISRHCLIEAELVEQRTLVVVLTPHHRPSPTQNIVRRRNQCSPKPSNHFCNKICQKRTLPACFGNERGRQLRRPLMQITRRSALRAQSGRWLQQPIVPFASNCYLRSHGLCCHFALSSDISLGVFIPFAK